MRILVAIALVAAVPMTTAVRADPVQLYAAGSLRPALTEAAKAFEAETGTAVAMTFGPSGTLKDEIAAGARADVFASANMEHPQALNAAGKSGPVQMFARNKLCALARPGLRVDSESLLDVMLDPAIKLATSTPRADPSGDYAFEVFRKADRMKPGARAALEKKALQLVGTAASAQPPAGQSVYGWHIAAGRADVFLAYCTAAREAKQQNPDQQIIVLPPSLAVAADYGLTVMSTAPAAASSFAAFILSPKGQGILQAYGFGAPDR